MFDVFLFFALLIHFRGHMVNTLLTFDFSQSKLT
ncbi:Uncharacterised protein [Vibrio cholerae]|nr:Uncharacterised protein [Vibrio cholerae]